MKQRVTLYKGKSVEVTYDSAICLHAGECVAGSARAFDPKRSQWVDPNGESPATILTIVARCPTSALRARKLDPDIETPKLPTTSKVQISRDGPMYIHSPDIKINGASAGHRMALCRCGASSHKPFCDRSHRTIGFEDPGSINSDIRADMTQDTSLRITLCEDGPIIAEGAMEIRAASGRVALRCQRVVLCRCGGSKISPSVMVAMRRLALRPPAFNHPMPSKTVCNTPPPLTRVCEMCYFRSTSTNQNTY